MTDVSKKFPSKDVEDGMQTYFLDQLHQIERVRKLSEMEMIIEKLDLNLELGNLAFCVAIYIIDKRKLFREADCTSLTEYIRTYAHDFDLSPSELSRSRKIGEGYYVNRYRFHMLGLTEDDLKGRLSQLPFLSDALGKYDLGTVKEAFLNKNTEEFKQFAGTLHRTMTGNAKLPRTVSVENFESNLLTLLANKGLQEETDFMLSVYTKDPESGQYHFKKSVGQVDQAKAIDIMYKVGFKNSKLHFLQLWMITDVPALVTDKPFDQRSSKLVFEDDHELPEKPVRERILTDVRNHLNKLSYPE